MLRYTLVLLLLTACGEVESRRPGGAAPVEADAASATERPIRLELPRIVGLHGDDAGYGPETEIDGAQVCLSWERRLGGTFDEFRETHGPCTTAAGGEPTALEVPPGRELVVTVHAEGYRPVAVPVVSGTRETTVTVSAVVLASTDSSGSLIARIPSGAHGTLFVTAWSVRSARLAWLAGASFSLSPEAGDGPHYVLGGAAVEGSVTPLTDAFLVPIDVSAVPGAFFFAVPAGDYRVRIEHPRATCLAHGFTMSGAIGGYPDSENTLRAPVLEGYDTAALSFECRCDVSGLTLEEIAQVDPATCAMETAPADAGSQDASY
jgi:hypothetical protein